MELYLQLNFNAERLTEEISNPESEFYGARKDGAIAGYLKLNFGQAQNELRDQNGLEIERIYVLKKFQGKQIGQSLYQKACAVAQARQASFIWLGVWEKNFKAQHFYKKNGFVAFSQHLFILGEDEQVDILMKRSLPIDPAKPANRF